MGNKKLKAGKKRTWTGGKQSRGSVQSSQGIKEVTSAKESEPSDTVNVSVRIALEEERQTRHVDRQKMDDT